MNTPALTKSLHAAYCRESGMVLRASIGDCCQRDYYWVQFLNAGFTESDLVLVIRYLKREIKDGNRRIGALKFSNLVMRLDGFEEDLGMAKATERNRVPPATSRERALEQFRATPTIRPSKDAKPIGDYIRDLREAAQ